MRGRVGTVLLLSALGACTRPSSPPSQAALKVAAEQYDPDRLLDALDRLKGWHTKHRPELAKKLAPGLTKDAIDAQTKGLPCRLPEELYELYQWHDGTGIEDSASALGTDFVWYHAFLSLADAMRAYEANQKSRRWPKNWFPIFHFQEEHYFVICEPEARPASPIYLKLDEVPDRLLAFTNLTSMIETNVVWFESGVAEDLPDATVEEIREKARRRAEIHRTINPVGEYPYTIR